MAVNTYSAYPIVASKPDPSDPASWWVGFAVPHPHGQSTVTVVGHVFVTVLED